MRFEPFFFLPLFSGPPEDRTLWRGGFPPLGFVRLALPEPLAGDEAAKDATARPPPDSRRAAAAPRPPALLLSVGSVAVRREPLGSLLEPLFRLAKASLSVLKRGSPLPPATSPVECLALEATLAPFLPRCTLSGTPRAPRAPPPAGARSEQSAASKVGEGEDWGGSAGEAAKALPLPPRGDPLRDVLRGVCWACPPPCKGCEALAASTKLWCRLLEVPSGGLLVGEVPVLPPPPPPPVARGCWAGEAAAACLLACACGLGA